VFMAHDIAYEKTKQDRTNNTENVCNHFPASFRGGLPPLWPLARAASALRLVVALPPILPPFKPPLRPISARYLLTSLGIVAITPRSISQKRVNVSRKNNLNYFHRPY
jgi:hypothetical protein